MDMLADCLDRSTGRRHCFNPGVHMWATSHQATYMAHTQQQRRAVWCHEVSTAMHAKGTALHSRQFILTAPAPMLAGKRP